MRILLLLLFLIIRTQDIQSSKIFTKFNIDDAPLIRQSQEPTQLRDIQDLWNSVKNSAINAWDSLKNIANKTGERISAWIQNVKAKAKDLNAFFKSRLQIIKEEINTLIANIQVTGEIVKRCIQLEQKEIDEILTQILINVTTCISQSVQYLSLLEESSAQLLIDETEFINNVENKLRTCLNSDHIEQCLNDVRKNVYDELEHEEKDILKNRDETRAVVDDILSTIASCSSNGLIEASAAITNTTIRIIKCATKN